MNSQPAMLHPAPSLQPFLARRGIRRVTVILIKPTHYDDDGFPHRYLRGVLPSNSLAVMYALTHKALTELLGDSTRFECYMYEDGIDRHARALSELEGRFPEAGTLTIMCSVAVQTAQFPRAQDLIARWQALGAVCVIGGFHVSGSIATMHDGVSDQLRPDIPSPHVMPAEIRELMDRGVVVFHGEAEDVWKQTLSDILLGEQKQLYRGGLPDLSDAPLPVHDEGYFERSFATVIGTFDTSRGCPFVCSFCTIINVQGRKSRYRSPDAIAAQVQSMCRTRGKASFFLTDDNFARNPLWRQVLDGFIHLRAQGYAVNFMIEADLACGRIPGFLEHLAAAGCTQIFMGVESMNVDNLAQVQKKQNRVAEYEALWRRCHELGIFVHAGYIVGFPHDTPESIARDVAELQRLGVDQASFFMLTPLPGSEDHVRAVADGVAMDPDFSKCDSFHAIVDHPRMSREEWTAAYERAWHQFYTTSHMITALKRCHSRESRMNLLRNFMWTRWSFATERTHPMIAGFYRLRPYCDRRSNAPPLFFARYLAQETLRHIRYAGRFLSEFYRLQHIVFETECAPAIAQGREHLSDRLTGFGDWFGKTFARYPTRRWLHTFWRTYAGRRWRLLTPRSLHLHLKALPHAASEVIYTIRFALRFHRLLKVTTS